MNLDRSMFYYVSVKDDSEVENKLLEYAEKLHNYGFPEYYKRIRKEGKIWNHKRVRRVYRKLGLTRRKKYKRRIPNPKKQTLLQPLEMNLTWSMDFMSDSLENGRRFRTFNVIDDFNREALLIEPDYSFPSMKVIELLKNLIEYHGKPEQIRTDNGTEFLSHIFQNFCNENGIEHVKIQKGKPMQNGYVERFNKSYRGGVLNAFLFESLQQVRTETVKWQEDYNENHPHKSLANRTPREFKRTINYGKLPVQKTAHEFPTINSHNKNKSSIFEV